jgi:hypothetical protein
MTSNEGPADRLVRSMLGIPLAAGGIAFYPLVPHWGFLVAAAVGLVLATTGLIGFCPLYRIVGLSTKVGHGGGIKPA